MNPMGVNNNNNPHGSMMSPMCNNNMMPGGPGSMPTPMNPVLPGQMGPNPAGMMHGNMPMKCPSQPSPMDMMSDSANPNQLMSNNVLPPLGNFSSDQFPLSPHTFSLLGTKMISSLPSQLLWD